MNSAGFNTLFIKKIEDVVNNYNIQYISFDLFDTLLRRRCYEPKDVFKIVAKKVSELEPSFFLSDDEYCQLRIESESNIRKTNKYEEIEFEDIFTNMPFNSRIKTILKETELEVEKEILYADPLMYQVLSNLQDRINVNFILISDMYLPELFIKSVLDRLYPKFNYKKIFLSTSTKKTKFTGNLFLYALNCLNIYPNNMLHIGDNIRSDHKIPQGLGIHTIFYGFSEEQKLKKEREYLLQDGKSKDYIIDMARFYATCNYTNNFTNNEEHAGYKLGAFVFGPVIDIFLMWLNEYCNKMKIEKILFISKEENILNKVIMHINKSDSKSKILSIPLNSISINSISDNEYLNTIKTFSKKHLITVEKLLELFKLQKSNFADFLHLTASDFFDGNLDNPCAKEQLIKLLLKNKNTAHSITYIKNEYISNCINSISEQKSFAYATLGPDYKLIQELNNIINDKSRINLILFSSNNNSVRSVCNDCYIIPFLLNKKNNTFLTKSLSDNYKVITSFFTNVNNYNSSCNSINILKSKIHSRNNIMTNKNYFIDAFIKGIFKYIDSRQIISNEFAVTDALREECVSILSRFVICPTFEEVNYVYSTNENHCFFKQKNLSLIKKIGLNNFFSNIQQSPLFCYKNNITWPYGLITYINKDFCSNMMNLKIDDPQIRIIQNTIIKLIKNKFNEVSLYGAGEIGEKLLNECKKNNISIKYVLDSRAKNGTFKKFGRQVVPLEKNLFEEDDVIVISSIAYECDIKKEINNVCSGIKLHIIGLCK